MAEETKSVVIEFSGRNLVKVTADEVNDSITHIQLNMRSIAMDFTRAGSSLEQLNRSLFNNSVIGREVASVFQGIGASLRIITIISDFAKMVGLLNTAEATSAVTTTAASAARLGSIGSLVAKTAAEWAHSAAVTASNIAQAISNALQGPWGWAILAGAAAAAATAIAWVTGMIPSKQYGGPILETGPYLLHAGETVLPSGNGAPTPVSLASIPNPPNLDIALSKLNDSLGSSLKNVAHAGDMIIMTSIVSGVILPSKQLGGPILETGPYMLHAGEYVVPSTIQGGAGGGAGGIVNNVSINDPIFRNRSDMDFLINRLKRMGKA